MIEKYALIIIALLLFSLFFTIFLLMRRRFNRYPADVVDLKDYVPRDIYAKLEEDLSNRSQLLETRNDQIMELNKKLAYSEEANRNLVEKLETERKEIEKIQVKLNEKFELIAGRLFDEKGKKFTELNEKKISGLINPFKERLSEFKNEVENLYKEESKEVISLKIEIKNLVSLNQQISRDADNLTKALKGDPKVQGDWGELQLEIILEKAGLEKNIHYKKQEVLSDESNRKKRPDFIINLPEGKNIIIDSKVSLTAYEKYFSSDNDQEKAVFLKDHIRSVFDHISGLGKKNYQSLYAINSPDYILMYMPIESALILALRENPKLLEDALERNIVFVTTSTLLATLRTVSYLWKHEKQKKNVAEIARQGGALYDKFVNFLTDLNSLGEKLDMAKSSYNSAMNKLVSGGKKGDTIIGRIEKLKELGANATKKIPEKFK